MPGAKHAGRKPDLQFSLGLAPAPFFSSLLGLARSLRPWFTYDQSPHIPGPGQCPVHSWAIPGGFCSATPLRSSQEASGLPSVPVPEIPGCDSSWENLLD